jgi:hypothetical protein
LTLRFYQTDGSGDAKWAQQFQRQLKMRGLLTYSSSVVLTQRNLLFIVSVTWILTFCATLIKKKKKFASYVRKLRWDRLQRHIRGMASQMYEEMRKYFTKYEEAVSHI